MKKLLSLLVIGALVAGAIIGLGNRTVRANPLDPALAALSSAILQDLEGVDVERLPDCLINFLANPQDPATIEMAFECLRPRLDDSSQVEQREFATVDETGEVQKAIELKCVYKNNAGAKWNVTVFYRCKDGEIIPEPAKFQDHSTGPTLSYTWNVSVIKTSQPGVGKVTVNLQWMWFWGTDLFCKEVTCECK
jgi:hypothetical protein